MNLASIVRILIGGNEQKQTNTNATQELHWTCALLTGTVSSKWWWKILRRARWIYLKISCKTVKLYRFFLWYLGCTKVLFLCLFHCLWFDLLLRVYKCKVWTYSFVLSFVFCLCLRLCHFFLAFLFHCQTEQLKLYSYIGFKFYLNFQILVFKMSIQSN